MVGVHIRHSISKFREYPCPSTEYMRVRVTVGACLNRERGSGKETEKEDKKE